MITAIWTAVAGVATATAAIVAIVAVVFAARDLHDRSRPVVIAEIRIPKGGSSSLDFVVRNAGQSVARNVRVAFDPPLQNEDPTTFSLRTALARRYALKIPVLAPGQELSNAIAIDDEDEQRSDLPHKFGVKVVYDRKKKSHYEEEFQFDLEVYFNETTRTIRSSNSVESRLRDLARILDRIERRLPRN